MDLFRKIVESRDEKERLALGVRFLEQYALDILPPSPVTKVHSKYSWCVEFEFENKDYEIVVIEHPRINDDSPECYKITLQTRKTIRMPEPQPKELPDYVQAAMLEGYKVFEYNLYPRHGYSAFLGASWEDGGVNVDEYGRAKTDCQGNSIGTALIHEFDPNNEFHKRLARLWYYGE